MPRTDTATSPIEETILDVYDEISLQPTVIERRGQWVGIDLSGARTSIFSIVTGAAAVGNRFQGGLWYTITSAVSSVRTRHFRDMQWPIGQDMSLAPIPFRYPRRYIMEAVLQRDALVANVNLFFGFGFVGVSLIDTGVGTAPAGFMVNSNSTINGGNWTVQRRLVNAAAPAALTSSTDSGIPGVTQVLARIVYEQTSNPRLWCELNGSVFGLVSGVAAMPTLPTSQDWFFVFGNGDTGGGGVGQIDRVRGTRLIVQQLAGYDR